MSDVKKIIDKMTDITAAVNAAVDEMMASPTWNDRAGITRESLVRAFFRQINTGTL